MAKLSSAVAGASLSQYPPAGYHTFEIKKVEFKDFDSGSGGFEFKLSVIGSDDVPEAVGRTFFITLVTRKKDGDLNAIGAADVKRIVAAAESKEASEDEDYDTDNLVGKQFAAKLSVKTNEDGQENPRLSQHAAV